jgi:hypothetical protein
MMRQFRLLSWLDRLAYRYLSYRLTYPYGTWVILPEGATYHILEKSSNLTGDPLDQIARVAIKVHKPKSKLEAQP